MTAFWHPMLRQTATLWAPDGGGFAAPEVIACLWFEKKQRFYSEDGRKGADQTEIITVNELARGSVLALGSHTGAAPATLAGLHEVDSTEATELPDGSATLHQANILPVWGLLPETVQIYAVTRQATARSYQLGRGALLYDGPASVIRQGQPGAAAVRETQPGGTWAAEWDVLVTVPATEPLRAAVRVEVDWTGAHGALTMHGLGGLHDSSWSPFWIGIGCTLRKETALHLPNPWTQEFTEEFGA